MNLMDGAAATATTRRRRRRKKIVESRIAKIKAKDRAEKILLLTYA